LIERLGYDVPPTAVVQSRREAMEAFRELGGDCVVKPIFGGEGRGVMRVREESLAWTVFSTLEQIDAIVYLQRFIPPGGRDLRLLVIGEEVWGIRREAPTGWRTNVSQGARSRAVAVDDGQRRMARQIAAAIGIEIGSVDLIDAEDGRPRVLEVNGVPGWKGAQAALGIQLAEPMLGHLLRRIQAWPAAGFSAEAGVPPVAPSTVPGDPAEREPG
jgi:RimK family alpha-L-glutamate ligase